jgi:hypothetical protein
MITNILIALAILLVLLLVTASLRPGDFRVERSITVSAPPAAAFVYVNNLRKWQEMSPYVRLDPAARYTFSGPPAGTGASLAWAGNSQAGEGRITITESRPNELIRMKLEMVKPIACTNAVEFTFRPAGDKITVTWGISGKCNLPAKVMGLFMNMDKMCGAQFEEGLANLKSLAEAAA